MEKAFALPSVDGIFNTVQDVCVCECVCVCVCESNGNEAKKGHQGQEASNPKLTDIIGTSGF